MFVGALKLELFLPSVRSLKERRKILQSIKTQLKNRYNISVAEKNNNNLWQRATLGVSCVTDFHSNTTEILQQVLDFISKFSEVEIIKKEIDIY